MDRVLLDHVHILLRICLYYLNSLQSILAYRGPITIAHVSFGSGVSNLPLFDSNMGLPYLQKDEGRDLCLVDRGLLDTENYIYTGTNI